MHRVVTSVVTTTVQMSNIHRDWLSCLQRTPGLFTLDNDRVIRPTFFSGRFLCAIGVWAEMKYE